MRLVVVPMKDPCQAKTRLGPELGPAERAALALGLFKVNLRRLRAAQAASRRGFDLAVVTRSPLVAALAEEAGALAIREQAARSLSEAAEEAADWAAAQGYGSLCLLPADLAAPRQADLLALLDSPDEAALCPSADGGTNALLLPLPRPIAFAYGPGSFAAHLAALRAAGLHPRLPALESLRHDVDHLEHLAILPQGVFAPELRP